MKAHIQPQERSLTDPKSYTFSVRRRINLEVLGLLVQTWEPGVDLVYLYELLQTNFRYSLVEALTKHGKMILCTALVSYISL